MPLVGVAIDDRTLSRGSEAQHVEWDTYVRELLSHAEDAFDGEATLHVSVTEQHFVVDLVAANAEVRHTKTIPHETLAEHITEYVDIVRQIARAVGLNQIEALDMAKKVAHDRGARVLRRELRQLGFDHEAMRRLFTLLLSLRVDTTKLTGIHGHRPIR